MNKPEISEKELEELKVMCEKMRHFDQMKPFKADKFILQSWDIKNKLLKAIPDLVHALEQQRKENLKLQNGMIAQANKIYYLQIINMAARELPKNVLRRYPRLQQALRGGEGG